MRIYITLDYELFFGRISGSVEDCIIKPTQKLLEILDPHNIKLTLFVDAGYLMALKRQEEEFPQLSEDYNTIAAQIDELYQKGHSIQLHIHPHWEDSYFKNGKWEFNTNRYKLTDFNNAEILDIVSTYHNCIKEITKKPCTAYRAGGWSAQPFTAIGAALESENIFTDSTVFPGGYYQSEQQLYDFTQVPMHAPRYNFHNNLTTPVAQGKFLELPIAAHRVSPVFFWKFAYHKILKKPEHKAYGNGAAIAKQKDDVFRLLTRSSNSVVSIDGYKASYLKAAFNRYNNAKSNPQDFVIIGHPKAFTPYSLKKVGEFVKNYQATHSFELM